MNFEPLKLRIWNYNPVYSWLQMSTKNSYILFRERKRWQEKERGKILWLKWDDRSEMLKRVSRWFRYESERKYPVDLCRWSTSLTQFSSHLIQFLPLSSHSFLTFFCFTHTTEFGFFGLIRFLLCLFYTNSLHWTSIVFFLFSLFSLPFIYSPSPRM